MDYEMCLKETGKLALNNVEMCTQEAAWYLLRLPMSEASRKVETVPTQHPTERFLMKKSLKELNDQHIENHSTDIWKLNIIQKYEQRPHELKEVCLADFVAWYDVTRLKKNNQLPFYMRDDSNNEDNTQTQHSEGTTDSTVPSKYRKRKLAKVLKWRSYDYTKDPLNFKRELVTLFWPFNNEELDILDNDKYIQIYEEHFTQLQNKYDEYNSGLSLQRLTTIAREFNKENVITEECSPVVGPSVRSVQDNDFLAEPHQSAKNLDLDSIARSSVVIRVENVMPHSEFCSAYRQLNLKQLTFLLEFINRLSFTPHEQNHRPLQVFFTGPAGTGKSFVLKLLMDTANRFSLRHNTTKCAFVACATTGKAAVNIDGTTIHTAFNIGINTKRNSNLREDLLHNMRCDFNEVTTIIVDEVSMMSYDILKQIDSRLRAVSRDANANFGGFHVIFCGDLRQLPPVNAKPVFARPPNLLQTRMLWHSLDYFFLDEVVRQKDTMFSTILTKIGNGERC